MNKLLATLGCALITFFSLNAGAAPVVCNAAETIKVCRDYDPEKGLVLGGPAQEEFSSALDACAGTPVDFSSQRYSDCQDNSEISKLRKTANDEKDNLRAKHAFMQSRCDPGWAKSRVCGTSADKQGTSAKPGMGAVPNITLSRVESNKPSAEQIANTRKAAETDLKRKADEAADIKTKEEAGEVKAQEREKLARASCMKPENRGTCGCLRFFPEDKGTRKVCGK